ncbi:sensor histidine kinase [Altererythrobacter soli]|uniref:histidine kinase n=1 Tax=Croceibacterium soli TaxID=1739690 RepID=A0A6I4UXQ2_9SPHN|nr:HAMP domain-containing sensor histidine kinase [Croceibacterium soli]MXP42363.1 sensor histidine kinase [Croceibacterium soli]
MTATAAYFARARTDGRDWLVEADEPLAGLQLRSGGELPGIVATPALLEMVRKARRYGLKLARAIRAQDGREQVTAWVEIEPEADGEGCTIGIANWHATALPPADAAMADARRVAIERQVAEMSVRLGPDQQVIAVECDSEELEGIAARLRASRGERWTDLIQLDLDDGPGEPLDWRLLDGTRISIPGSSRHWKAVLLPLGPRPEKAGFELLLVADEPPAEQPPVAAKAEPRTIFDAAMGREIAPVLRQPIARIIANAETIRTQLAGPVAEEYSKYAADIATAGEHLLALIDDLTDLEVVESDTFDTAPDTIDLADVARRAAGILGVRAQERAIEIHAPGEDDSIPAVGEFRRVLQILLNLLGNALRYAPEGSHVRLIVERNDGRAQVTVADQGPGLSADQQAKVFEKFERLGRSGDGGSGLGLYISRRLARAMAGELSVESTPGEGARFTLDLPSFEERRTKPR